MYISPVEMHVENLRLMTMEAAEDGIIKAMWNMGFTINREQLTSALVQDKKRYETAYDKGWNDCKEFYEKKLQKISEVIAGTSERIAGETNGE